MRSTILAAAVCLLLLLAASSALAEEAPPAGLADRSHDATARVVEDRAWIPCEGSTYARMTGSPYRTAPRRDWRGTVAAYLWATDISGTSYAGGVPTDIDVAFSDLFDDVESAFMGYAEVQYKRWSFAVDASYVSLKQSGTDATLGIVQYDLELDQTIIDLRLGYTVLCREVGKAQWGSCCYPRMMTLDVVVGARYWNLEPELTLSVPQRAPITVGEDESWWDPYVGASWRWQFAKRWGLGVYGDIGGFDIGDGSELTWKLQALLRFQITRGLFVGLGYRAIDVDRVSGSGAGQNGVDATYHGPILGLGFVF